MTELTVNTFYSGRGVVLLADCHKPLNLTYRPAGLDRRYTVDWCCYNAGLPPTTSLKVTQHSWWRRQLGGTGNWTTVFHHPLTNQRLVCLRLQWQNCTWTHV